MRILIALALMLLALPLMGSSAYADEGDVGGTDAVTSPEAPVAETPPVLSPVVPAGDAPDADPAAPPAAADEPTAEAPAPETTVQQPAAEKPTTQGANTLAAPLAAPLAVTSPALALPVSQTGGFEIDGDTAQNNGGADWAQQGSVVNDGFGDSGNFKGASKEFGNPGGWSSQAGIASGATDIGDVYAYSTTYNSDVWAFFAFTRDSTGGTTAFDVEYNQKPNLAANPPQPNRTAGDLLVQLVQHGSSDFAVQTAYIWTLQSDTKWKSACVDVAGYTPASGWCPSAVAAASFTGATSADGKFAEGALNVSALFGAGTCGGDFGTINIRSRSSDSASAALKDWASPTGVQVPSTCAKLVINKSDANGAALGGATFQISPNPTSGSAPAPALTVKDNDARDRDKTDGIVEVDAVEPGSYTVTETVGPTGYLLPNDRSQGPRAVERSGTLTFDFTDPRQWLPLTATVTAAATYDASYAWSIDKTVGKTAHDQAETVEQHVPAGTTAQFLYTLGVTQGARTTSNWTVTGNLSVGNPNPEAVVGTLIDTVSDGTTCTFPGLGDVDPGVAGMQVSVPPGGLAYGYRCRYASAAAATSGTNTATVHWDLAAYPETQAQVDDPATAGQGTVTATKAYTFTAASETNKTVTVTDTQHAFDPAWTITWTAEGTVETPRNYPTGYDGTPGRCTTYHNTARIIGDAQAVLDSAQAHAKVCVGQDLVVSKSAALRYDRTYHWSIAKTGPGTVVVGETVDPTTGAKSTTADVGYRVTVTPDGFEDSNQTLSGAIIVENPNRWQAITATVTDDVSLAGVTCAPVGVDADPASGFQVIVPPTDAGDPGTTVSYTCTGLTEDSYVGTTTATVEWDTATYATPAGAAHDTVAIQATGRAADQTITVSDPMAPAGTLSAVSWNDGPHTFTYTRTLSTDPGRCTSYDNTATIVSTGQHADATVRVCSPEVTKTALGTYDRSYKWLIGKSVDESRSEIAEDGTATFGYAVTATPNGSTDGGYAVSGTVTVTNPTGSNDLRVDVADEVGITGATCPVTGGGSQVAVPADGMPVTLRYSCTLPPGFTPPAEDTTNTATVSWDNDEQVTADAAVHFDLSASGEANKTVTVTDDKASPLLPATELGAAVWNEAGTPTVFRYVLQQQGEAGRCTDILNTARIVETGQSATRQVTVCVERALSVAKTADASYDRTYDWEIDKAVDESRVEIAEGDAASVGYRLEVTPNGYVDSDKRLTGTITVSNPNGWETVTADVTDEANFGAGLTCVVDGGQDVLIPVAENGVAGSVSRDYTCDVGNVSEADYTGHLTTATATWVSTVGEKSASDSHAVRFGLDDETNKTATVTDSRYAPAEPMVLTWPEGDTFEYTLGFDGVPGECTTYHNTAQVVGDVENLLDEDGASVQVCVQKDLVLAETVQASYDRTYTWDIAKAVDRAKVVTGTGAAPVNYTVDATPRGFVDSGWQMTGSVTVANPNSYKDVTVQITDTPAVGDGAACAVDGDQDQVLVAGQTRAYTYTCTFEGKPSYTGTSSATVTWAPWTQGGVGGEATTGPVPVVFEVDEETNRTVTVTDDMTDPSNLGAATWTTEGAATHFGYAVDLDVPTAGCGDVVNTATIVATGQTARATVTVCRQAATPTERPMTPTETSPDSPVTPTGTPPARVSPTVLAATGAPSGMGSWAVVGGLTLILGAWLMLKGRRNTRPSRR